jgi:hypothetical protein
MERINFKAVYRLPSASPKPFSSQKLAITFGLVWCADPLPTPYWVVPDG